MAVSASQVTAGELLRMPDDGMRHELVLGELRVTPPPGFEHGRVALRIGRFLDAHAATTGSGVAVGAETGFLLATDPDTVRAPDAAFVSNQRVAQMVDPTKYFAGAPDLAVEVISPGDTFHDVQAKALEWLAAGSVAVLLLDPAKRTATVYRGRGDAHIHPAHDTLDLDDAVPGFSVSLAEIFA